MEFSVLSKVFIDAELLHHSSNNIAITMNTIPLDFQVIHLYSRKLMLLGYPHSFILFMSKSITFDLPDMLNLHETHHFHLFFELHLTCTLSNSVYRIIMAFELVFQLCLILMFWGFDKPMAFAYQRRHNKLFFFLVYIYNFYYPLVLTVPFLTRNVYLPVWHSQPYEW